MISGELVWIWTKWTKQESPPLRWVNELKEMLVPERRFLIKEAKRGAIFTEKAC